MRREGLTVKNIKNRVVCSEHFEESAYNNKMDISTSRLKFNAYPTIVKCPNPPQLMTPSRPTPKPRANPPPRKRKRDDHPMSDAYVNAIRSLSCSFSTTELLEKITIDRNSNCQQELQESSIITNMSPNTHPDPSTNNNLCNSTTVIETTPLNNIPDEICEDSIIEENVVAYVSGSLINRLKKDKNYCQDCLSLSTTSVITNKHTLVLLKEYKPGCMVRVSEPVSQLCELFEHHFQSSTLSIVNTRKNLISSFVQKLDIHQFALNCPNNHIQNHVYQILSHYSIVRIFHHIKHVNREMKKNKKGSELNKNRKLNM